MALETSLFKGLNISKIVGGFSSTLNIVNRAIPIYKQVSPMVKNVKSAFNTVNSIKEAKKEEQMKEIKSFERPITIYKKKDETRGSLDLDTLTFFQ